MFINWCCSGTFVQIRGKTANYCNGVTAGIVLDAGNGVSLSVVIYEGIFIINYIYLQTFFVNFIGYHYHVQYQTHRMW